MSDNENVNEVEKQFSQGENKTITRRQGQVNKEDLESQWGTDQDDTHDNFVSNNTKGSGYYAPSKGKYTNNFKNKDVTGVKPAFKNNEVTILKLEKIEELSFEHLKPLVYTLPSVLKQHDDRQHRKGHQQEGKIILDDQVFTCTIMNMVEPAKMDQWVKTQRAKNKFKLDANNSKMIMVDLDWQEKIKDQKKTIHRKGKSGKMITNLDRVEALKRKRIEIEKVAAARELIDDQVWFPNPDFTAQNVQPIGKQFVPVNDYSVLKQNANRMNNILIESSEMAKSLPYKATKHFVDQGQRKFQYEQTRVEVQSYYSAYNITIPSFEDAVAMWDNN